MAVMTSGPRPIGYPDGQIAMMQNFQGQGIVWISEIDAYNGNQMMSAPAMA
jgi:hypothetical protein